MNMKIFWPSLLLLLELSADVFLRPINIGRNHLGKPTWIMSKAGDQMPDINITELRNNSFDDNMNMIHPFINWNGVLKMVVPIHRSSGITGYTREVVPDVYNWDSLPCFRNSRMSDRCEYCDDGGENGGNRFGKTPMIAMYLLAIFLIACIVVCSCLTCRHKPGCHHLKNDDKTTSNSSTVDSRDENDGKNCTL